MIIDLKRSIDLRWLFGPVLSQAPKFPKHDVFAKGPALHILTWSYVTAYLISGRQRRARRCPWPSRCQGDGQDLTLSISFKNLILSMSFKNLIPLISFRHQMNLISSKSRPGWGTWACVTAKCDYSTERGNENLFSQRAAGLSGEILDGDHGKWKRWTFPFCEKVKVLQWMFFSNQSESGRPISLIESESDPKFDFCSSAGGPLVEGHGGRRQRPPGSKGPKKTRRWKK